MKFLKETYAYIGVENCR